jgi:hypothetical protein
MSMNQLTTIAALPGSGAGCASALKREVAEQRFKPATAGAVTVNFVNFQTNALAEAQAKVAQQIAESTRRTLLRIAGATA